MALNLFKSKTRNDDKELGRLLGECDSKTLSLRDSIDYARAELPADWVLTVTLERSYTKITLLKPNGEYAELPKGLHPADKLLQAIAIAKKMDK
jgi:hypothetical protein